MWNLAIRGAALLGSLANRVAALLVGIGAGGGDNRTPADRCLERPAGVRKRFEHACVPIRV
jgi:hypothetical protein